MAGLPALGIDVGGGSAKIGIVAADGSVLGKCEVASRRGSGAAELVDHYLAAAARLQHETGTPRLAGIGIGLPGHIDAAAGATRVSNVPALDGYPVARHVRASTGLPTAIENDATLAALGEHRFGAGRGSGRFMTVTLGTGIGVGFIVDGRPVHTANGTLGDIGHAIVDPSGAAACRQGCHGCLESVASGEALAQRFRVMRADSASGPGGDGEDLSGLFAGARAGEEACRRIVEEAAGWLAAGLVGWLHILAPGRIAIGGGMAAAGPVLLEPLVAGVRRLAMPGYLAGLEILPAQLGSLAGLVGAAALALDGQAAERRAT